MSSTVAVTGASGYVGINLIPLLLDRGHEVVAIDRVRSPHLPDQVRYVEADVLDQAALTEAFGGAQVVYHLAAVITLAHESELAWRVNTQGVRSSTRAALAAGVRRFVLCSSVHSYDDRRDRLDESSPRATDPALGVYDRSKWAAEQILLEAVADGLHGVAVNPTGVFGPRDYGLTRLNGVVRDAAKGAMPVVTAGGYDLVDVRDGAQGLLLAAERGRTGENYLLPGHRWPVAELCRQAAALTGRRGPRVVLPLAPLRRMAPLLDAVLRRFGNDVLSPHAIAALAAFPVVDGAKAARDLGYHPRPAKETLADLIAFLRETGKDSGRQLSVRH
ncbi:MAG: NAD-dependent epimerase/dehydratase family protein [Micrococcales bacterium]|nr:NAD-dependent epimerase/dehydratase family protein [Micrococcales bacterium]